MRTKSTIKEVESLLNYDLYIILFILNLKKKTINSLLKNYNKQPNALQ